MFQVRMDVAIPPDMDPRQRADMAHHEKLYHQQLKPGAA